jgi:hypothetical protein
MNCPRCQSTARPGAAFCRQCGGSLAPASAPAVRPAHEIGEARNLIQPTATSTAIARPAPVGTEAATASELSGGTVIQPSAATVAPQKPVREMGGGDGVMPSRAEESTKRPYSDANPSTASNPTRAQASRGTANPKRRIGWMVAAGAVVVVLAAGGAAAYVGWLPVWPGRSTTVPAEARESVRRGLIFASERRYDRAIVEFGQAIARAPTYAAGYANRGIAYMQTGERVKALDDLRKAAELDPRDAMAQYNLAALYAVEGERTFALDALQSAFEAGFRDVDALRRDSDFASIRREVRFQNLIDRYRGN